MAALTHRALQILDKHISEARSIHARRVRNEALASLQALRVRVVARLHKEVRYTSTVEAESHDMLVKGMVWREQTRLWVMSDHEAHGGHGSYWSVGMIRDAYYRGKYATRYYGSAEELLGYETMGSSTHFSVYFQNKFMFRCRDYVDFTHLLHGINDQRPPSWNLKATHGVWAYIPGIGWGRGILDDPTERYRAQWDNGVLVSVTIAGSDENLAEKFR